MHLELSLCSVAMVCSRRIEATLILEFKVQHFQVSNHSGIVSLVGKNKQESLIYLGHFALELLTQVILYLGYGEAL